MNTCLQCRYVYNTGDWQDGDYFCALQPEHRAVVKEHFCGQFAIGEDIGSQLLTRRWARENPGHNWEKRAKDAQRKLKKANARIAKLRESPQCQS